MKNIIESINKLFLIKEATSDSGSRGSYVAPLMPGFKKFKKIDIQPFTDKVSEYDSALLSYDSYDGSMDETKKQIKKLEKQAENSTKMLAKNPIQNDEDGDNINPFPKGIPKKQKKIREAADTTLSSGEYTGPIEIGLKKWRSQELGPFSEFSTHPVNKTKKQKTLKNNKKRNVGIWEKHPESGYEIPTHDVHTINEDLGVWFGTKKKPKGSKQPKGPWVNICKKVDGKHPPCGRPDASDKAYPKCRAAGVAGKMSNSQKKAACQQKRRAEKTHPKSGTGNSPKMVSYKPRKKKTNEEILIDRLIKKII
jgi:hypothetical protein